MDTTALAARLQETAEHARRDEGAALLLAEHPWVAEQLDEDAASGIFDAWGASTVIDENVGAAVIPRSIVAELAASGGLEDEYPQGNAGVLHVYGYLFADVATPYGAKRDRWLDGILAGALGLPPEHFLPESGDGTMLMRVTTALLPVVMGEAEGEMLLDRTDAIAPGVDARTVLFRAAGSRSAAVVYALEQTEGLRLITAFPFDGDPEELSALPTALRYNAVLPAERIRPRLPNPEALIIT